MLIVLISLLFASCNESPSCKDFKEGNYNIVSENALSDFAVIRNLDSQIETNEYGDKTYYSIEWISECSFISMFDDTKMVLNDEMRMINSDGGLVVELLEVLDDDCISYQSYVKNFKELSLRKGKFCRIE